MFPLKGWLAVTAILLCSRCLCASRDIDSKVEDAEVCIEESVPSTYLSGADMRRVSVLPRDVRVEPWLSIVYLLYTFNEVQ